MNLRSKVIFTIFFVYAFYLQSYNALGYGPEDKVFKFGLRFAPAQFNYLSVNPIKDCDKVSLEVLKESDSDKYTNFKSESRQKAIHEFGTKFFI